MTQSETSCPTVVDQTVQRAERRHAPKKKRGAWKLKKRKKDDAQPIPLHIPDA